MKHHQLSQRIVAIVALGLLLSCSSETTGTAEPPSVSAPPSAADEAPRMQGPKRLKIVLSSTPSGATVYDKSTDKLLGFTPLEHYVLAKDSPRKLLVDLHGYRELKLEVPGNQAVERTVELERLEGFPLEASDAAPPPTKKKLKVKKVKE